MVAGLDQINRQNVAVAGLVSGLGLMAHSYRNAPRPTAQPSETAKPVKSWNWNKIEMYTGVTASVVSAASLVWNR